LTQSGPFFIGTASWTDKTLIESGAFYPKGATTAEERLRFYAEQFPIVEVDSTYYFPPSSRNAALWADRTPTHFTFHIKAYSLLTQHPTRIESIPSDLREELNQDEQRKKRVYAKNLPSHVVDEMWDRFREALMPLHSSGKLGVIHFQFPEWFLPSNESREYIEQCVDRLPDYRIAVEFRNASWMTDKNLERTQAFLTSKAIPFTNVDMPQGFRSSLPPSSLVTADDLAYVRFHGRNDEEWDKQHETATPRFAYEYSEDELREWVPRLHEIASKAREVHILMNNCYRDYAQRNAKKLAELLHQDVV